MKRFFFALIPILALISDAFAGSLISREDIGFGWKSPEWTIISSSLTLVWVLTLIQAILLKLVMPVIVIWASLYIAYELLTAEWDETKMKKAWKSLTFSSIALVIVAVSYALVAIISRIAI
jgi:ABC-type spermidine/putrescine transport system permease subunit II